MTTGKVLSGLMLVAMLTPMPAANAQVVQILQLATGVVRVLPKLIKSNSPKNNGQNNNQNNGQNYPGSERDYQMGNVNASNNDQSSNQTANGNGRHHHQMAANNDPNDAIQSMHGSLIGSRVPASNTQSSSQAVSTPAQPAPFVMMSNP
jgi:hypothetical protein